MAMVPTALFVGWEYGIDPRVLWMRRPGSRLPAADRNGLAVNPGKSRIPHHDHRFDMPGCNPAKLSPDSFPAEVDVCG
jgi:hypothetical protein